MCGGFRLERLMRGWGCDVVKIWLALGALAVEGVVLAWLVVIHAWEWLSGLV